MQFDKGGASAIFGEGSRAGEESDDKRDDHEDDDDEEEEDGCT